MSSKYFYRHRLSKRLQQEVVKCHVLTAAVCCHYCMSEMLLYVKGGYEAKQQNAKSAM